MHFGLPSVNRNHLPRHDGAASALHLVDRPGRLSPRQRYLWGGAAVVVVVDISLIIVFSSSSSFSIEELSVISVLLWLLVLGFPDVVVLVVSGIRASRSQRTVTRSPKKLRNRLVNESQFASKVANLLALGCMGVVYGRL